MPALSCLALGLVLSAPAGPATPPPRPPAPLHPPIIPPAQDAAITYIGEARVPFDATDLSGLTDTLNGVPHNRLGSFGSAIAATATPGRYVGVDDRGPQDGAVPFVCRYHTFELAIDPAAMPPVAFKLLGTTFLSGEKREPFRGNAGRFDPAHPASLHYSRRLDPEGARLAPDGTLIVCDEYGPSIARFAADGALIEQLPVPEMFLCKQPNVEAEAEAKANTSGRVPNRGFEGLAISPSGDKVWALLQSPLIQDGGRDGLFCRMLEIDLRTKATRQLVYPLDKPSLGTNEILAVSGTSFLVIERDGGEGEKASTKLVTLIDTARATDVSGIASLPKSTLPEGVVPVAKRRLIDLLDPAFGLAGKNFPEKIEGLAFGPALPDGAVPLIVVSDNDFRDGVDTRLWVFRVPVAMLPGYTPPSGPAPTKR